MHTTSRIHATKMTTHEPTAAHNDSWSGLFNGLSSVLYANLARGRDGGESTDPTGVSLKKETGESPKPEA